MGFMGAAQNVMERGTVIAIDAQRQTHRVRTNSGRTMVMSRLRTHPGDVIVLPVGTPVVVSFALGLPYIIGVLPPESAATNEELPTTITDVDGHGGNDPLLNRNLGASSRGANEPRDVVPGDFVGVGPDGASVAALHGKVAQIKGSALAKVQAFGDTDLVQIVAGIMRVLTWMGESRVINEDGKTSFIWRGGTDQLTQTGHDEERYTIKLNVGHTGNMINLEVCNRDQQALFRFHVDPAGKLEIFAAGGIEQHGGTTDNQVHPSHVTGSVEEVITGGTDQTVSGDVALTHEGNHRHSVSGAANELVGQDKSVQVGRNLITKVSGDATELVVGDRTTSTGGDVTDEVLTPGRFHAVKTNGGPVKVETNLGPWRVKTLGGPALIDAAAGPVTVIGGAVEVAASASFALNAPPEAITFGSGATYGSVRWEALNDILQGLVGSINTLNALIFSHTHGGPVAPTLEPLGVPLTLDISSARSGVKIG